jgi:3-isopropylmalate/(R)-2-methylmalate dehydratase large subunit
MREDGNDDHRKDSGKTCREKKVEPGELINARVDLVFANENTGDLAIDQFKKAGFNKVFDPNRVMFVADHFIPPKDISCAQQFRNVRLFFREMGLSNFLDVGRVGIEHILLPELGLLKPGDSAGCADTHTCSAGVLGAFASGAWPKEDSALKSQRQ